MNMNEHIYRYRQNLKFRPPDSGRSKTPSYFYINSIYTLLTTFSSSRANYKESLINSEFLINIPFYFFSKNEQIYLINQMFSWVRHAGLHPSLLKEVSLGETNHTERNQKIVRFVFNLCLKFPNLKKSSIIKQNTDLIIKSTVSCIKSTVSCKSAVKRVQ